MAEIECGDISHSTYSSYIMTWVPLLRDVGDLGVCAVFFCFFFSESRVCDYAIMVKVML